MISNERPSPYGQRSYHTSAPKPSVPEETLKTEKVQIDFKKDAIEELASIASTVNASLADIGARRLHTVVERLLEEISFTAPDISPTRITIDAKYVRDKLKGIVEDQDLRKFIL